MVFLSSLKSSLCWTCGCVYDFWCAYHGVCGMCCLCVGDFGSFRHEDDDRCSPTVFMSMLISELLCELGTLSSFQCDRCRLLDVLLDMECIPACMICLMFGLPTSHLLPTCVCNIFDCGEFWQTLVPFSCQTIRSKPSTICGECLIHMWQTIIIYLARTWSSSHQLTSFDLVQLDDAGDTIFSAKLRLQ